MFAGAKRSKTSLFQLKANHPRMCVFSYPGIARLVLLLPCLPDALNSRTWPRYSEAVPAYQKWRFLVKTSKVRHRTEQADRHTNKHVNTHRATNRSTISLQVIVSDRFITFTGSQAKTVRILCQLQLHHKVTICENACIRCNYLIITHTLQTKISSLICCIKTHTRHTSQLLFATMMYVIFLLTYLRRNPGC